VTAEARPVRWPCPVPGCLQYLGDVQPTVADGVWTGKCPEHGRRVVRKKEVRK
jgi:hypothetical protein